ncbi:MAG: hypothetical protein FJX29_06445 [Alphaproteobacteria bacterium]|nr:hypothetical protein [Alphaproteobacteria bacterium]
MERVEFRHAIGRAAAFALSGGVCGLYSLASALQWLPENAAQGRTGYLIGMAVFLPFTAFQLWRIFDRKPVLTMGPEGLFDRRLAPQTIPWQSIERIADGAQGRHKFLLITPDASLQAHLQLTRTAQLYHDGLRASGIDGLRIAAQGLDGKHEDLLAAAWRFWNAYRGADGAPSGSASPAPDE